MATNPGALSLKETAGSRKERNWFAFVLRHNDDARRWVLDYRNSECWDLMMASFHALDLLRERRIFDAFIALEELNEGLTLLRVDCPSLRHVVERYYYPVIAYGHYVLREFDIAEQCLNSATESVATAISLNRFLLPLADICLDFRYQKARLARSRRNWKAVKQHFDCIESMLDGLTPLCELPDGTGILLGDLQNFYAAIQLNDEERLSMTDLLDSKARIKIFRRTCAGIYTVPEFVIPYP